MLTANILLYLNVYIYKKEIKNNTCLESFIQSSSLWMLLLFVYTEVLSLFSGIGQLSLWLVWGITDLFLFGLLVLQFQKRSYSFKKLIYDIFPDYAGAKKYVLSPLGLISLIPILAAVLLAYNTVPYNWDSMTYHLPRIAHWAQNGSVAHYATNIVRQIASPVLGEFVNLHVYVMTGGNDKLFNLLQCFSYLMCAVMVYHIAKKIKCDMAFCKVATVLYLSMPIAFAEALTTQVDDFATVWLLFFVYLLLDFTNPEKKILWNSANIQKVAAMGLCVAWGYLVKPSVCIAMVIFAFWLLVICIVRKDSVVTLLKLIGSALPCVVLPLIPEILRNLHSFHAISSSQTGARQLVGTLHPLYLVMNTWKNIAQNLPIRNLNRLSDFLYRGTLKMARIMQIDLNAASISEDGRIYELPGAPDYGHDTAINPLIVWLLILCIILLVTRLKKIEWKKLYTSYSLVAVFSFGVFCMLLRWEPFVTRYMVSYLALLCPVVALQLQKQTAGNKWKKVRLMLAGALCVVCVLDIGSMVSYHYDMCTVYGANTRPYGYFTNRTTEYEGQMALAEAVKAGGYQNIGIYLGVDSYEYPLWTMLQDSVTQIQHVNVNNESAIYLDANFVPDCILWMGTVPKEGFAWNGVHYGTVQEVMTMKGFSLLAKGE